MKSLNFCLSGKVGTLLEVCFFLHVAHTFKSFFLRYDCFL